MTEAEETAMGLIIIVLALGYLLINLILYIFHSIGVQKIAKRQGVKSHWAAWVPIVSSFLFVHLTESIVHKPLKGNMVLLYGVTLVTAFLGGFWRLPILAIFSIITIIYAFYFLAKRYSKRYIAHFVVAVITLGASVSISVFIFRNNEDTNAFENQRIENEQ